MQFILITAALVVQKLLLLPLVLLDLLLVILILLDLVLLVLVMDLVKRFLTLLFKSIELHLHIDQYFIDNIQIPCHEQRFEILVNLDPSLTQPF